MMCACGHHIYDHRGKGYCIACDCNDFKDETMNINGNERRISLDKPTPPVAGPGQKNIYKISFVEWHDDTLRIGGKENTKTKNVTGSSHRAAVAKLREHHGPELEVVGIEHQGVLDIE